MIRLERRDPARNMQRFYVLDVTPTLFGEWILTQTWGRIGRPGQVRTRTYADRTQADAMASMTERQKKRRGYKAC